MAGDRVGRNFFTAFGDDSASEAFFRSSGVFEPRARVAVVAQTSLGTSSRGCGRKDREDQESTRTCVSHAVRNALGRDEQVSRAHR